jgi:serine/threonine protein phosphatase PrpC
MTSTPVVCRGCGDVVQADDRFCEACGTRLVEAPGGDVISADRRELDDGRVAAVSDRGLVHRRNEDAFFLHAGALGTVAVVCDGVSSSVAPDIAARLAADTAGAILRNGLGADGARETMLAAITAAQLAVAELPWTPAPNRGAPSCTFVGATYTGSEIIVGSAGDSRAYWVDADDAVLLTRDDSWAEEMIAAGTLGAREAMADARAHMITAWLGVDAPADPPEIVTFAPMRRGRLIVCSDGLWNAAPGADDLADLVRAQPRSAPPIAVARALADVAVRAGGHDNITVAIVDVESATEPEEER